MANDRNPDRWGRLTQLPSEVEITVLPDRDGRARRGRIVEIYGLARAHTMIVLHSGSAYSRTVPCHPISEAADGVDPARLGPPRFGIRLALALSRPLPRPHDRF